MEESAVACCCLLCVCVLFTDYFFGPDLHERRWFWITPGSAFGASVWLVASVGFRVYLHFFDSYSALYGSLGAVMILLAWLYLTGLAFLVGGEINAEIDRVAANEFNGARLASSSGSRQAH